MLASLMALPFCFNIQECGPRFTLKLRSLQHGTFDSKGGEFEWVHKVLLYPSVMLFLSTLQLFMLLVMSFGSFCLSFEFQGDMDTSRRRFFL